VNQQVATELLESEGAYVQIAGDGRQGVEAVAGCREPFDVVLMDMQMPVMDGVEATHEIRHTLGMRDLPIIAMTANAMQSDREACLAAGMNDHVGKPFDLNQLVKTILKYVPEPQVVPEEGVLGSGVSDSGLPPGVSLDGTPPGSSAVNGISPLVLQPMPPIPGLSVGLEPAGVPVGVDVLDLHGALDRMGCGDDLYVELLPSFLDELPIQLGSARQQIDAGTPDEARRAVHTIKGLAATMGAMALSRAAAAVESALKDTSPTAHVMDLLDAADQAAALADHLLRQVLPFAAQGRVLADFVPRMAPLPDGDGVSAGAATASVAPVPVASPLAATAPTTPTLPMRTTGLSDGVGGLALLNLLGDLLSAGDMTALDVGQQLQTRHGELLGERGHDLHLALQHLDFTTAAQCCADIRSKGLLS
jgi:CheY-like chemotaxis protein